MKIMHCPLNGPRNITEFAYGGEVKAMPDSGVATDEAWAEYLFMEENRKGVVKEWWLHIPSSYWFIAERDAGADTILRTYPASELFKERVEFAPKDTE
jgi:sarcosine oxidase subunit delta